MQSYKKVLLVSLITILNCLNYGCSNKMVSRSYKSDRKLWTHQLHSKHNNVNTLSNRQSYNKKNIRIIKHEHQKQLPGLSAKEPRITSSTFYPKYQLNRSNFSLSSPYSEYWINIDINTSICRKQRVENRIPRDSLKVLKNFRKVHFEKQTAEVQARIKKSRQESDRINRKGDTFFDRIRKIMKNLI